MTATQPAPTVAVERLEQIWRNTFPDPDADDSYTWPTILEVRALVEQLQAATTAQAVLKAELAGWAERAMELEITLAGMQRIRQRFALDETKAQPEACQAALVAVVRAAERATWAWAATVGAQAEETELNTQMQALCERLEEYARAAVSGQDVTP